MHKPKASPVTPRVSFGGALNRHEHDLMAAFEKFKGEVNIVEECAAQVGHLPGKEQDFHCLYCPSRFV
jgi:hypothetical protein